MIIEEKQVNEKQEEDRFADLLHNKIIAIQQITLQIEQKLEQVEEQLDVRIA